MVVEVDAPVALGGLGGVGFDDVVMVGAEQDAVGQVGASAGGPGLDAVVGLAVGGRSVAAGEGAALVADGEGR